MKHDAKTSREVFGDYIHTYKFGEAVEDEVVLDLVYEARDISQELGSPQKVDAWFEAKTKGLNDWQKAALREQWGTMQRVLSARSRMDRVVEERHLRSFASQSNRRKPSLNTSTTSAAIPRYQMI
jgi:type I restriction enzyme R subunit